VPAGQHRRTLRIYAEGYGILDARFTTLAEVLGEQGYAMFGITANPRMNTSFDLHQGCDGYVDGNEVYPLIQTATDSPLYKATTVRSDPAMFRRAMELVEAREGRPTRADPAVREPEAPAVVSSNPATKKGLRSSSPQKR
jgi:hypothetical protein